MKREAAVLIRALSLALAIALTAAAARAETVEIVAKFPAGRLYQQTTSDVAETVVTDTASGATQKFTSKFFKEAAATVVRSDESGPLVEVVYKTLAASTSGPTGSDSYDSAKDKPDATPLAQGLSPWVNAKVQYHFNTAGRVEKVEGFAAIWAAHPGAKEKNVFRLSFDEEQARQSLNVLLLLLPAKPVSVGDAWESETAGSIADIAMKYHAQCKLLRTSERKGHKLAEIEFITRGKMAGTPAASKAKIDKLELKGTAEFDLTQGWFTSADVDAQTALSMEVTQPDGNTIAVTSETTRANTLSYRW